MIELLALDTASNNPLGKVPFPPPYGIIIFLTLVPYNKLVGILKVFLESSYFKINWSSSAPLSIVEIATLDLNLHFWRILALEL